MLSIWIWDFASKPVLKIQYKQILADFVQWLIQSVQHVLTHLFLQPTHNRVQTVKGLSIQLKINVRLVYFQTVKCADIGPNGLQINTDVFNVKLVITLQNHLPVIRVICQIVIDVTTQKTRANVINAVQTITEIQLRYV